MAAKKKQKQSQPEVVAGPNEMFKTVYGFNPITGEYTGETKAQMSPLEPGVYLVPANATETAPPDAQVGKMRVFKDGSWSLQDILAPPAPPEKTTEQKAEEARGRRNGLLYACDWTQLSDVPAWVINQLSAWTTYRQALRDVPQQQNFPNDITWPTAPVKP